MRRTSAAVLLSLLGFAVPAAAPAQAPPEFTKKALTFQVTVGPKGAEKQCKVDADLYTPAGASAANPVPAVMSTNGFGGSKADQSTLAASYARRGYVFLSYSGLGFGNSGCKITLDDPDFDGRAAVQLVDFLGGSKAAEGGMKIDYVTRDRVALDGSRHPDDPRLGMIGGSYGGEIQFSLAGQDPRLDAIVPQITWNELSYSLGANNTDFTRGVETRTPGVLKLDWPVLFTAVGLSGTFSTSSGVDQTDLGPCPNFDDRTCTALVESGARGYPSDATRAFLHHASVSDYIEKIKIPTLLSQGQSDNLFNVQEAIATYETLREQGTPVKMLWRSAGHSGGNIGASESTASNPEAAYESRMALEWFDFYLRGLGDAPTLDFSFLTDWIPYDAGKDAAAAVGSTPSFPASTDSRLFLSGADKLVTDPGTIQKGSAPFAAVSVAPTSTGGGLADTVATDRPGTSVSFTGPPLTENVDVVGASTLTVKLDAPVHAGTQGADPGGKLVVFAKLFDVAPNGTATLPRNLISSARVFDVTKPVTIELPGISHRFAKGNQMRLVLSSSAASYRGNTVSGPVTVTVDPATPSVLTIPRLGAQAGALGSGPGGTTPFTPSPQAGRTQKAGSGQVPGARAAGAKSGAARLPRSCRSRRSFRIRLRRAPKGDRLRSAVVTVNGRRVRAVKGKRLTAPVNLRGLPKGTFRVTVTARTKRGRTLRSARTYRTCVPKKK